MLLQSLTLDSVHVVCCVALLHCRAVERLLRNEPDLINLRMEEGGYVALHIAAVNNHYLAALALLEQENVSDEISKDFTSPWSSPLDQYPICIANRQWFQVL